MSFDLKNKTYDELLNLAKNSYSPYSKFRVSCIIYLKDGKKIGGVNIENAAYSPTLCGERSALAQLVSLGYNKKDVERFCLYTDSKKVGTMCGVCRQFMIELLDSNQEIEIYNVDGFCLKEKLEKFLPYYFDKEFLR